MIQNRFLISAAALLLAADVGLALFWHPVEALHLRELPAPQASIPLLATEPSGGDFAFDTAHGPFRLADQRGKVVLLYFGYSFCPDICPTSLLAIAGAVKQLTPQEQSKVKTVFVSVDPQRDTVDHLAEYVRFFHPAFVGATGDRKSIDDAVRRYGASYAIHFPQGSNRYVIDHSAQNYLINRDGKLAGTLPHGVTPDQVAISIKRLLSTPMQGARL